MCMVGSFVWGKKQKPFHNCKRTLLRRQTSRGKVRGLWGAMLSRPEKGLSARHDYLSCSVMLRGCSCVAVCRNVSQCVAVCCSMLQGGHTSWLSASCWRESRPPSRKQQQQWRAWRSWPRMTRRSCRSSSHSCTSTPAQIWQFGPCIYVNYIYTYMYSFILHKLRS